MFSELLLKRNMGDLGFYYTVGGFMSLVVWAENDLISVSKTWRTEAHSYTLQPSQLKTAEALIIFHWTD